MKRRKATVLFIFFVSCSVVCCAKAPPPESPETGYSITGFVRTCPPSPLISETVELIDSATGISINRVKTNTAGKYRFSHLPPGRYVIRVGDVTRTVILRDCSKRLDIELNDCPECRRR